MMVIICLLIELYARQQMSVFPNMSNHLLELSSQPLQQGRDMTSFPGTHETELQINQQINTTSDTKWAANFKSPHYSRLERR